MVTIVLAIIVPVNNIFSVISFSLYGHESFSIKKLLLDVIKNPMVIFTLAGIVVAAFGIKFPLVIESTMNNLVRMTTPLALIVMGGTFNFGKLRYTSKSLFGAVALRLLIVPAVALFIAVYFLGFRGDDIIAVLVAPLDRLLYPATHKLLSQAGMLTWPIKLSYLLPYAQCSHSLFSSLY